MNRSYLLWMVNLLSLVLLPAYVGAQDAAALKKAHEVLLKEFKAQKTKDTLYLLTENSFLSHRWKPVAGRPVLLAAGLRIWIENMPTVNIHHWVKFEIVHGPGYLASFPEYAPGTAEPEKKPRTLEAYGQDGACAYAWLVTDPKAKGEVLVRAVYSSQGDWAPFADPRSAVTFKVDPVALPAGQDQDPAALREREYANIQTPSREVVDEFSFENGYHIGKVGYKRRVILRKADGTLILDQGPNGAVTEAAAGEEVADYQSRNERWRFLPPGLTGVLSHLDPSSGGFVITSRFTGKLDYAYGTPPEIPEVEFAQYDPTCLPAGPVASRRLLIQEWTKPNLRVTQQRMARSQPWSEKGIYGWGSQAEWTCASIKEEEPFRYKARVLLDRRTKDLGTPEDAKRRLKRDWDKPVKTPVAAPDEASLSTIGLSYQDPTPSLAKKFPGYSLPVGPVVTQVREDSPASNLGLEEGDILLLVDSQGVRSCADLGKLLAVRDPQEPLLALYWRDGNLMGGWTDK